MHGCVTIFVFTGIVYTHKNVSIRTLFGDNVAVAVFVNDTDNESGKIPFKFLENIYSVNKNNRNTIWVCFIFVLMGCSHSSPS